MKHGAMGLPSTLEAMPFDDALKTPPFYPSTDINDIANLEKVTNTYLLTKLIFIRIINAKFLNMIISNLSGIFAVPGQRFGNPTFLFRLKTDLNGVISFLCNGFFLKDNTWPCLDDSNADSRSHLREDSGHPDFFS